MCAAASSAALTKSKPKWYSRRSEKYAASCPRTSDAACVASISKLGRFRMC